jgi:hypothetical protein
VFLRIDAPIWVSALDVAVEKTAQFAEGDSVAAKTMRIPRKRTRFAEGDRFLLGCRVSDCFGAQR